MLKETYQRLYDTKSDLLDGFNLYLYGVILKELDLKQQARSVLVESVNLYPWNWKYESNVGMKSY